MQKSFSIMSRCNLKQKYSIDSIVRAKKRLNTLFGSFFQTMIWKDKHIFLKKILILTLSFYEFFNNLTPFHKVFAQFCISV